MFVVHFTLIYYPVLHLLFHLLITLGSVANSNPGFEADKISLSELSSAPVLAELNTALAVETQAGINDERGLVATDSPNTGDISEAPPRLDH